MRLTLRTLLAYLDDTLEPTEIKQIGQKVAESDAAQELIARIKQVTRKRRLTTPPATGPGSFEPNMVADYLDNELTSEQVAELEKLCLESDVHLAEVAACHQILTLVLGQPALVPPTARERMYGLVKGREAIPFRKALAAPAASGSALDVDGDNDETPLLSLAFLGKTNWVSWVLPAAAVLLVGSLALALWQAMGPPAAPAVPGPVAAVNPGSASADKDSRPALVEITPKDNAAKDAQAKDGKAKDAPSKDVAGKDTPSKDGGTRPDTPPVPMPMPDPMAIAPVKPAKRLEPPSTERVQLGSYLLPPGANSLLVSRPAEGWKRLNSNSPVFSNEQLVSLPGYSSELRLNSNVRLVLRGNLPDFSPHPIMDYLLDSSVRLHKNPDQDLDFTLERGRVYVSNTKPEGAVRVRVRIGEEIWDLTLGEPGTEVGIDMMRHYSRDINYRDGEEPRTEVYLCALQGKAALKIDTYHRYEVEAPPGNALFQWNNKDGPPAEPVSIGPTVPRVWSKEIPFKEWDKELETAREQLPTLPPDQARQIQPRLEQLTRKVKQARAMQVATTEMVKSMKDGKPVAIGVMEMVSSSTREQRLLGIYCLCAIDEITNLLDVLGNENPAYAEERDTAIYALRRWLSWNSKQGDRLFKDDGKVKKGILLTKFRSDEASMIFELLHDFSDAVGKDVATFNYLIDRPLRSDRVAIRELAFWHLLRLSYPTPLPPFNASWPEDQRRFVIDSLEKMIKEGKLPPKPDKPAG